mmetsp:Transcript_32225/g.49972  ORF Transcript_32225/g.49972 Transcript_32225/m.49972 type:complete len:624 (+) Transcript_32225:222-2093(+)
MSKVPSCVGIALGIASQDWSRLGLGDDPAVAASSEIDVCVDRIAALLLIRVVAWIQPRGTYSDLSITTICRQILVKEDAWPSTITPEVIQQISAYVKTILAKYQDTPYHNLEHCYHVTISTNKMLEMLLQPIQDEPRPTTFGLRDDPLMQLVLIFSALIHDVEHQGIPNRQLANEDDLLAIQYNDTSIAEHRSLYIAFSELLKPEFALLRKTLFPEPSDYRRFRAACVNLVLSTDIADPERTQISKSKWKEAFGDPYETVERKVLRKIERGTAGRNSIGPPRASRRMSAQSIMSELSLDSPLPNPDESMLDDDTSVSLSDADEDDDDNNRNNNGGAHNHQQPVMLQASDGIGPKFVPPTSETNSPTPPINSLSPMMTGSRPPPMRSKSEAAVTYGGGVRRQGKKMSSEDGMSQASASSGVAGMAMKFQRRLSSIGHGSSASAKRYRSTRLGLLRTVDLTGESIETYSRTAARPSATGAVAAVSDVPLVIASPPEEVDALREAVVMEVIIKAADVAHNLQGWDLMAKWSNRLFLELRRAHVHNRGENPQNGWFSNQIGFLEAYLLPLARRLDDTGVFGYHAGARFAEIVEENRDRWHREGMALTAKIISEGERIYPAEESDDEG